MLNPNWYYNSSVNGHSVLEIVGPEAPKGFIPLRSTILRGQLCGPMATFRMTHRFLFTEKEWTQPLEALYRFPLPGDAAVSGVLVTFGDTTIEARLERREKAEKEYQEAKEEGKQAALVTRESPDVFTLHVHGILPGEEVSVTTTYVQLGVAEGYGFAFRVPLTTMPRYVRQDEGGNRFAKGQPLAVMVDPGHRFFMEITCIEGELSSSSHALVSHDRAYTLAGREVIPDRDLLLSWTPSVLADRPALVALSEGNVQPSYLVMFTPPAGRQERCPMDLQILVDHSGSMSGAKWAAADWAVDKLLLSLREEDRFNLCLFESSTHWYQAGPVQASKANVASARQFLLGRDSGGTELGMAIEQALLQPVASGRIARHLILITDAEVSDAGRILRLVEEEREKKDGRRCSIICIDSSPNSYLANELAELGNGVSRFLTSSPQEGDITSALDEVLEEICRPLLKEWTLTSTERIAPGGSLEFSPRGGRYAARLDDLPAGRSRFFLLRAETMAPGGGFALLDEEGVEQARVQTEEMPGVGMLYGARIIRRLEAIMASGTEKKDLAAKVRALGEKLPTTRSSRRVYAENAMSEARAALAPLITDLALRYKVASSETAFIAVAQKKGHKATRTVIVANALAQGWDESFVSNSQVLMSAGAAAPMPSPPGSQIMSRKAVMASCRDGPPEGAEDEPQPRSGPLFSGAPAWQAGKALLFDSSLGAEALPPLLTKLRAEAEGGDLQDVFLLLYLEDLQAPKVRVRLSDILDLGGVRPINIRHEGKRLMLVLVNEGGGRGPEKISVSLS